MTSSFYKLIIKLSKFQLDSKLLMKENSSQFKIQIDSGLKERTVDIDEYLQYKNITNWAKAGGKELFTRLHSFPVWIRTQKKRELWLYNRRMLTAPQSELLGMDQNNNIIYGINFASADYLGLAKNQQAVKAAVQAVQKVGISSGGSPLTLGNTTYYVQLEKQLADFWDVKGMVIYSAGWLAGFGVIKALVSPQDHIIMDQLSHNCLVQGANAATKNITRFQHLNHEAMVEILKKTRNADPDNGILVITEGLFSMDADVPNLNKIQQTCKQYGAFLLIDAAHDFGCMGQNGKGNWQVQKLKDRSNVIMIGTGSKCLSTNIGFAGCEDTKVTEYLKAASSAYQFTNTINPIQAATSLSNLRIIRSELGKQKRMQVMENYNYLRAALEKKGHKIFGTPCPILPLFVGNQIVCRLVSRLMMDYGVHVNGIEFPVVSLGQARLRVNLMPQHTKEHLDTFIECFERSLKKGTEIFQKAMKKYKEDQMEKAKSAATL